MMQLMSIDARRHGLPHGGAPSSPPGIRLANVTKTYSAGSKPALDALSAACPAGKITVIVGPSGCGKTSLLRCLCGLEEVDSGGVFFGDDEVTHVDARRRSVAMVFQNYALYPSKTVAENIAFPLRMAGVGRSERERRVLAAAALVKIEQYLDRLPSALSGGQRQRVGIARAIVRRPRVLLMDEPLSNLDAKLREEMRSELASLQHRIGATTVYVTHDQSEALSLSDHLILMRDGRIEQQGTPAQVFDKPTSKFAADFLGSMNFLELRGDENPHIGTLRAKLKELELPSFGNLTVGFRPEDVRLEKNDEPSLAVQARVLRLELLGRDFLTDMIVSGQPIRVRSRARLEFGGAVQLHIPVRYLNFFGSDGRRVEGTS